MLVYLPSGELMWINAPGPPAQSDFWDFVQKVTMLAGAVAAVHSLVEWTRK